MRIHIQKVEEGQWGLGFFRVDKEAWFVLVRRALVVKFC